MSYIREIKKNKKNFLINTEFEVRAIVIFFIFIFCSLDVKGVLNIKLDNSSNTHFKHCIFRKLYSN